MAKKKSTGLKSSKRKSSGSKTAKKGSSSKKRIMFKKMNKLAMRNNM